MTLLAGLSDLWAWWRAEMAAMMPQFPAGRRTPRAAANVEIRHDGLIVRLPGKSRPVDKLTVRDGAEAVKILRRNRGRLRISQPRIDVTIGPGCYLSRKLSDRTYPRSRLMAMARLNVEASTPFHLNQVYLFCCDGRAGSRSSGYLLVKKAMLQPLLDRLAMSDIQVRRLSFAGAGGFQPDPRDVFATLPRPKWRLAADRVQSVAISICVIVLAATIGHLYWRNAQASIELDRRIAAAEAQAATARALISQTNHRHNQIAAIRQATSQSGSLTQLLEELARIIPDTTWLDDIRIGDGEIMLAGVSQSAPDLIAALEQSDHFRQPKLRAPVNRLAGRTGARFRIAMTLEAPGG